MPLTRKLEAFLHRAEWNHVGFRADSHGKPINNGQRERKTYGEGSSFALLAGYMYGAAQGIYIAAHHVQANATAGKLGDPVGRRETRLKDKVVDFCFG